MLARLFPAVMILLRLQSCPVTKAAFVKFQVSYSQQDLEQYSSCWQCVAVSSVSCCCLAAGAQQSQGFAQDVYSSIRELNTNFWPQAGKASQDVPASHIVM